MSRPNDRQETFRPLRDKTVSNVLRHLFVTKFGYGNKVLFADAMIERILETLDAFMKPASMLKPGQLLWMAVANDGHRHLWKHMRDIPQVPVILDLVTDDDLRALAEGESYLSVRRRRHARILDQALAQGGVLAQSDLSAITVIHHVQISKDISQVLQSEGRILPYRGSVQDVGGTFTHKVEVIRLLEAGYLEPEICRLLSLPHSLRAVENYVQTYKNVMKLLERGFAPYEVSAILHVSKRLVLTYIGIVREHHPDIIARNPYLQEEQVSKTNRPSRGHMSQI